MGSSSPCSDDMAELLRAFRTPGLSPASVAKANRICKRELGVSFSHLQAENGFYIQSSTSCLKDSEITLLSWLLAETFEQDQFRFNVPFLSLLDKQDGLQVLLEFGPRMTFTTPFSTNAVTVCHNVGIHHVERIERTRRFLITCSAIPSQASIDALKAKLHDRMTECEYKDLLVFGVPRAPAPVRVIPVLEEGPAALERENKELGLAMDSQDLVYYHTLFATHLKRNPTDVELFDIAQSNSEHSRHWFFKGKLVIDKHEAPAHLFDMVSSTLHAVQAKHQDDNSVVALCDNSSAIRGTNVLVLETTDGGVSSTATELSLQHTQRHLTLTAETHNFPTGVAPFPGAETGTGGRLRDGGALGRGSLVLAGTAGYCVGCLGSSVPAPWEPQYPYPPNLASPIDILVDASNGASDYGNKFGEPVVVGFCRSFGGEVGGERREWIKPIMFSGGIGQVDNKHTTKNPPEPGMVIVKIGGPAYRIGIGGGAASSMVQGDNKCDLDFNAVQRGDAEMEQKMNRVIRACVELEDNNPIVSIHDQGAGGNCNVVKEIVSPVGGKVDLSLIEVGDPSLSALEVWGAEYQENSCVLIREKDKSLFDAICKREGCPVCYIGEVTDTGVMEVTAHTAVLPLGAVSNDPTPPATDTLVVNLPLDKVLGKMPQKVFELNHKEQSLTPLSLDLTSLDSISLAQHTLALLSLLDVGSKRFLTNKVDRSVTGLVVQQQCVGPLQTPVADYALVAQSHWSVCGIASSIGERPVLELIDPKCMARMTVAECITNLMFVKIDALRSVKCSGNWMWAAKLPGEGACLYDACDAMCNLMTQLGLSIDGGKDSLSMAARVGSTTVKAPGTLVLSTYAPCADITARVTPCLTRPASTLLYVPINPKHNSSKGVFEGRHWRLGGSAYARTHSQIGNECPDLDEGSRLEAVFECVQALLLPANKQGGSECHIAAGHDVSDGGLVATVLEMCMAGDLGASLTIPAEPAIAKQVLMSEEPGVVLEVAPEHVVAVQALFSQRGVDTAVIGHVTAERAVSVHSSHNGPATLLFELTLSEIRRAWESASRAIELQQTDPGCVEEEHSHILTAHAPTYSFPTPPPFASEKNADEASSTNGYLSALLSPHPLAPHSPKVAIIREEGSNGDREMSSAFRLAGFRTFDLHMSDLRSGKVTLESFRGVVFVGGFSYADVMDSAKGWAGSILLNDRLKAEFERFRNRADTFSLGVCNGAQLMMLLGWVPATESGETLPLEQQPRFIFNKSGRFESRFSTVRIEASPASSVMLKGLEGAVLGVWVAHGEGRAYFPDQTVQTKVDEQKLCAVRYVTWQGDVAVGYPENPNGSTGGIAALCSHDGRHLAIMPHPERCFLNWQWPYLPPSLSSAALQPSPWFTMFQNARVWCESKPTSL
eukprot:c8954_g1_i1.p1 GENE.c8954_g1_i1~~c8954_g1_i1.p1  ORF type:complete len:1396 (-),score=448.96 c8954_g1_i1:51-4238(-)